MDEIQGQLPTREQVAQPPSVQLKDVRFRYMNQTGLPLELILFDLYYYYFPKSEPIAPTNPCHSWEFPPTEDFQVFGDFTRGTGWYVFFVERLDTGKRYQLAIKNIFYSDRPTLVVRPTGDKDKPFEAVFGSQQ